MVRRWIAAMEGSAVDGESRFGMVLRAFLFAWMGFYGMYWGLMAVSTWLGGIDIDATWVALGHEPLAFRDVWHWAPIIAAMPAALVSRAVCVQRPPTRFPWGRIAAFVLLFAFADATTLLIGQGSPMAPLEVAREWLDSLGLALLSHLLVGPLLAVVYATFISRMLSPDLATGGPSA